MVVPFLQLMRQLLEDPCDAAVAHKSSNLEALRSSLNRVIFMLLNHLDYQEDNMNHHIRKQFYASNAYTQTVFVF